jgi:hypothetical protein
MARLGGWRAPAGIDQRAKLEVHTHSFSGPLLVFKAHTYQLPDRFGAAKTAVLTKRVDFLQHRAVHT